MDKPVKSVLSFLLPYTPPRTKRDIAKGDFNHILGTPFNMRIMRAVGGMARLTFAFRAGELDGVNDT
jgi:hypothetical protein